MPLITSCPQCKTQFIVKKEQLSAFDGQVRCGNCQHVFNASEHIIKPSRPKKSSSKKPKAHPASEPTPPVALADVEHIEISSPTHLQDAFYEDIAQEIKLETPASVARQSPSVVQDLSIDSRLQKHARKSFGWGYFLASLALLLALVTQLVYFYRTDISARYPQTKPWLALACQHAGCRVGLPKSIDLLTIDDSDIQEHLTHQGVLVFSSTLVNHAPYVQAYPNIELTLTNTDDEPILRRTLRADDYLDKSVKLDDGMPPNHELHLKLNIHPGDVPVAGYRVGLTYQ